MSTGAGMPKHSLWQLLVLTPSTFLTWVHAIRWHRGGASGYSEASSSPGRQRQAECVCLSKVMQHLLGHQTARLLTAAAVVQASPGLILLVCVEDGGSSYLCLWDLQSSWFPQMTAAFTAVTLSGRRKRSVELQSHVCDFPSPSTIKSFVWPRSCLRLN